jgi:hypothetical protein
MHIDQWLRKVHEEEMLKQASLEGTFDQMDPEDLLEIASGHATVEGVLNKMASKMSLQRREALPAKSFAVPETKAKKIGVAGEIKGEAKGKYPIPDPRHAKNALARVSQHGTPAERQAVRSKVYAKFPGLKEGFEERHGGESPTSKEHIKKVEQGGIGKTSAAKLQFLDKVARDLAHTHHEVMAGMEKQALVPGIMGYLSQGDPEATPRSGFWRGVGGGLVGGAAGAVPGILARSTPLRIGGALAGSLAGGYLGGRTARATPEEMAAYQAKKKKGMGKEKRGQVEGEGMTSFSEFTTPEAQAKAKTMQRAMKMAKGAPTRVRKGAVAAAGKELSRSYVR